MAIKKEILDELLKGYKKPEDLLGEGGLLKELIERALAIESVQRGFRKITKNRGAFPNDDIVIKLLYLALQNMEKKRTMPIRQGKMALNQFAILFGDRLPMQRWQNGTNGHLHGKSDKLEVYDKQRCFIKNSVTFF
jgi:hypothetical protein